jgi:hypothetical protein
VWRDPRRDPNDMLGWLRFHLFSGTERLDRVEAGQISKLATWATRDAIASNVNVTIGWGEDLETISRELRPTLVLCPEREDRFEMRWALSYNFQPAEIFPEVVIQKQIDEQVAALYPQWQHGRDFRPTALLLRHDVCAETLGLVGPAPVTPDMICGSVDDDPAVREANARFDRATPETHRDLVAARLAAQERAGVPPDERAPIYSGETDSYLLPIIMRMGRGDEPAVIAYLRRDLRRLYGEHGETVLRFMLRTHRHDGADRLLEAAKATAVVA